MKKEEMIIFKPLEMLRYFANELKKQKKQKRSQR